MTYFDPGSVIWKLNSTDKLDAIREIIYQAPVFVGHEGLDLDEFYDVVVAREELQSTALGHGVAVAHGRTEKVDSPQIALGVSRDGLDFDSPDGKPVRLLFIVANHPSQEVDYLQILSCLVAMVRDKFFRTALLRCEQLADLQQLLRQSFQQRLVQSRVRRAC